MTVALDDVLVVVVVVVVEVMVLVVNCFPARFPSAAGDSVRCCLLLTVVEQLSVPVVTRDTGASSTSVEEAWGAAAVGLGDVAVASAAVAVVALTR